MSTTSVTGTVTDSDAIAWQSGVVTFSLVSNFNTAPTSDGVPMTQAQRNFSVNLDNTGSFSTTVTDTDTIQPISRWSVKICSNTSAPCQTLANMEIKGASQSLTATISSQIQAIRLPAGYTTRAYADVEIIPPVQLGATYFNTISDVTRQWNGSSWVNQGGGGGGVGASATIEITAASPGSYTLTHNLNSIFYQSSCVVRSGSSYVPAVWADSPVDANNVSVTVPSAGNYIFAFSAVSTDFVIGVTPVPQTYWPTMSGTQQPVYTVNQIASGTYSGTVTYSVSGLASGMSGAFSPTTITGTGSTTLTLSFPSTQAPATTVFTITGTDGTITHTQNVSITIGNINQGLVEGWPMNDGSGNTFASGAGTGNTETKQAGTLTWASNPGLPGSTATFSATAYATGANHTTTDFDGSTPFSVSAWVKFTDLASFHIIVGDFDPATNFKGWELGTNIPAALVFSLNNNIATNHLQVFGCAEFQTNALYYLVATYDGSKSSSGVKLYQNGSPCTNNVAANTLTGSIQSGKNVALGARIDGTTANIGLMAYTRIYNRVLTATEIANYYAAGAR